jgi:hypothetical protein
MIPNIFTQSLVAASANNVAASQSPGAGVITLNGSTVSGGIATLDSQRRVLITSGGNDTGINFTVNGTNSAGFPISDTFAGGNPTAVSNLDFKTVTSVTHTGSIASTVTVGTNTTGSSLWQIVNWNAYPPNISVAVQLVTGTANFTVEHTYDDPNILPGTGGLNLAGFTFPVPWPDATLNGASASGETQINYAITAWRVTINSGTGTLSVRGMQDGISSP